MLAHCVVMVVMAVVAVVVVAAVVVVVVGVLVEERVCSVGISVVRVPADRCT